jgi:hypothetical protein
MKSIVNHEDHPKQAPINYNINITTIHNVSASTQGFEHQFNQGYPMDTSMQKSYQSTLYG